MKTLTLIEFVGAVVCHDSLSILSIHQPFSTCLDHSLHLLLRLTLVLPLVLPLTLVALVLTLHLALALVLSLHLALTLTLVLPLHLALTLTLVLQTAKAIISSREGIAPGLVLKPQVLPWLTCIRPKKLQARRLLAICFVAEKGIWRQAPHPPPPQLLLHFPAYRHEQAIW